MVKQTDKDPVQSPGADGDLGQVLVRLSGEDFRRNENDPWVAVREILITGPTETQPLIKEGREFKKGDLTIFGVDLAAMLERHAPQ